MVCALYTEVISRVASTVHTTKLRRNRPIMAEEPQPSDIQEGATEVQAPTGTAEDRKAAAALSSLDAQEDESSGKKEVDTKALGEAMKNLNVQAKADEEKKKVVKIEPADVSLLVRSYIRNVFPLLRREE